MSTEGMMNYLKVMYEGKSQEWIENKVQSMVQTDVEYNKHTDYRTFEIKIETMIEERVKEALNKKKILLCSTPHGSNFWYKKSNEDELKYTVETPSGKVDLGFVDEHHKSLLKRDRMEDREFRLPEVSWRELNKREVVGNREAVGHYRKKVLDELFFKQEYEVSFDNVTTEDFSLIGNEKYQPAPGEYDFCLNECEFEHFKLKPLARLHSSQGKIYFNESDTESFDLPYMLNGEIKFPPNMDYGKCCVLNTHENIVCSYSDTYGWKIDFDSRQKSQSESFRRPEAGICKKN